MSEPKPLASLNGSLLARKGSAKPAMRSQLMQPYVPVSTQGTEGANPLEDLGWNDMGEAHGHNQAEILQLTPSPINRIARATASLSWQARCWTTKGSLRWSSSSSAWPVQRIGRMWS